MVVHHLLTGSYTNSSLFLLAFDTIASSLTLNATVPGFGLHQFVTSNAARDRVYATTMSEPPRIFSWAMTPDYRFTHLNTVNVTSSSCYFSDDGRYAFSAGGPTARIHSLDDDGGISEQVDEMFYVPKEDIDNVTKTRAAVLYGAHGFDVNINNKGFVPHLGWDSIFMYNIAENGTAKLLSINLSPETGDGPRNVFPSKNGKYLYVINEHSQYLDVFEIGETRLDHKQRASAIPNEMRDKYTYRSNAVQLSRDGKYLFTSTRGWNNTEANGWVAAFPLNNRGLLTSEEALTYYKAPLTLGSAGGLRVAFWEDETNSNPKGLTDYMYLSDTSEGYMYILGWTPSKRTIHEVAALKYDNASPYEAVWLD
ncbi:Lactonase, 7-bladed beta-propeller-domain-containing protein [Bisporella sp. PMI_857]|nr:Lactonase, 7-bladed beta-propeller-domain-containing protein [Bisporella sp. PMI_857]